jgi:uncharacterized protein (DUF58 family)
VTLDLENRSPIPTSFLLLEDRLPTPLGRAARLVIGAIREGVHEQASYTLVPQSRGRYLLGPLVVDVSDPFALTRLRLEFPDRDELLVTPEVEDLGAAPDPSSGPSFGASRARQLFRTGEEYYTMRQYQEGDELMIRQDESSRRASGLVFFDTRAAGLGRTHTPAFERGVSVAASVGVLLARHGFVLRLGTTDLPAAALSEERFLDALTGIAHAEVRSIGPALAHMRSGSSPDTSLVFVSAPPVPAELGSLIRAGAGFGQKLAVLIYPTDPDRLPPERQAQIEGRASQARLSLARAGWDVIVLPPSMRLRERWHTPLERPLARIV